MPPIDTANLTRIATLTPFAAEDAAPAEGGEKPMTVEDMQKEMRANHAESMKEQLAIMEMTHEFNTDNMWMQALSATQKADDDTKKDILKKIG